ncbi:hypothetical protein [Clostridium omnivorum]|uniref:Membrane protein n=1 Tax=Clostridium omnivorum TaxID=1604902 RepID=A0ABQ5NBP6_9CLOT|nr:hypothetical protein [Clostridium sp. E14]GLC32685.1 membrane protein [Clostridium sp. E14]
MFTEYFKTKKYYLSLIALVFIISLIWIVTVNTQPFSDFSYYNDLAISIANGGQWGDTYTTVGYPIILGFIYKIFGANIFIAKIFNLILSMVNNILVLIILDKVKLKERDKMIIFLLFVFFPANIYFNSVLGTEILFTNIMLISTLVFFSHLKYKYFIIGFLVALNTMIKPFFILFVFLIFIVNWIVDKKLINSIKNSLIVLVVAFVFISPWVYRNTKLVGQMTYVSNNGGIVLYINNNSQNHNGRWMPVADVENSIINLPEFKNANMTEKNKMFSKEAKKWIVSHPKEFLNLGFKRLYNTYYLGDDVGYSLYDTNFSDEVKHKIFNFTNFTRNLVFIPATIYILICSVILIKDLLYKNTLNLFKVYMLVLYYMFTCVYFITEGQGRYAFPVIFILIYFFVELMLTIFDRLNIKVGSKKVKYS